LKIEANLGSNKCSKYAPKINSIPILKKIIIWSISSPNLPYVVCKIQPSNTQGFNVNLSPNNRYICMLIWCLNSTPNQPKHNPWSYMSTQQITFDLFWVIHWSKRASTWMESWRGHCYIILGKKKRKRQLIKEEEKRAPKCSTSWPNLIFQNTFRCCAHNFWLRCLNELLFNDLES